MSSPSGESADWPYRFKEGEPAVEDAPINKRPNREILAGALFGVAVPASIGAAWAEKQVLNNTVAVSPDSPSYQHQQAEFKVAEGLTAGALTVTLLITAGVIRARSSRHSV